ncbi:COX15/CtaA family protein [Poriferisphaera corsica]|nr:hypothetical protein [Poriferisphaera corsica]
MAKSQATELLKVIAMGVGINVISLIYMIIVIGVEPDRSYFAGDVSPELLQHIEGASAMALLVFLLWTVSVIVMSQLGRKSRWACRIHGWLLKAEMVTGGLLVIGGLMMPIWNVPLHVGLVFTAPGLFLMCAGIMMLYLTRRQMIGIESKIMRTKDLSD